jgi:glycosyltransferase involved in cell wall biosynthesis
MHKPLISVVIPVFNRENLIKKAIESVLCQTYSNYELIIVDDGSRDNTKKILRQYQITYPHIIKVIYSRNKGVSCARNIGIAKARGEYLAFLDSDDLWISSKLCEQIDFMLKKNLDICQTEEIWVRNNVRVNSKNKHKKKSGKIFYDSLVLCIISPSAVMIKKTVFENIGMFDEKLLACEDYDLWLRISLYYPIYTMSKSLIIKNGGHADQLSRKYWGMDRFRVYSMLKILRKEKQLDCFKKRALYYYLSDKAKVVASGAKKRKKIFLFFQYIIISRYYQKKWDKS